MKASKEFDGLTLELLKGLKEMKGFAFSYRASSSVHGFWFMTSILPKFSTLPPLRASILKESRVPLNQIPKCKPSITVGLRDDATTLE